MQLGPLTLTDHMILDGLETAPDVAWSKRRTLTGEAVVQVGVQSGGRDLVLRSGRKKVLLSEVEAVKLLAAAGQPVTMVHHRGTFEVLITKVEGQQAFDCADPAPEMWYTITINMIEVG